MRSFVLALSLLIVSSPAAVAQKKKPVEVNAQVTRASSGSRFAVSVNLTIRDGWHTYLSAGPDSFSPLTEITFKTPDGVRAVGDLVKPEGRAYDKNPGSMILEGTVRFSQEFEASPSATGAIKVKVAYQACDDEKCLRPTSTSVSVDLPKRTPSPFENPIRLMVGDQPLNVAARQMYPSPAFYDVDNDGQTELVVGDIFGSLNVYENTNDSGKGDPVWAKHTPLKTAEGEKIKVSNW